MRLCAPRGPGRASLAAAFVRVTEVAEDDFWIVSSLNLGSQLDERFKNQKFNEAVSAPNFFRGSPNINGGTYNPIGVSSHSG